MAPDAPFDAGCDGPCADSGDAGPAADDGGQPRTDDGGSGESGSDPEADEDGDGLADAEDNCPSVANSSQADLDGDRSGDACDDDQDGDAVADSADSCPRGAVGTDTDGDGCLDRGEDDDDDDDDVADSSDNCPLVANPAQEDHDTDLLGDACDDDDDDDGIPDASDACPTGLGTGPDQDGDGCKDAEDGDKDGDGTPDVEDACPEDAEGPEEVDRDGCPASLDACPLGFATGTDNDADGCQNAEDPEINSPAPAPARVYVDASQVAASPDGNSWETAFPSLADGLSTAATRIAEGAASVHVWVAEGTYRPDEGGSYAAGDTEATFEPGSQVALIGGFRFDPTLGHWVRDRAAETILSGDLSSDDGTGAALAFENQQGSNADNACHVVTIASGTMGVVVDGFRISGGYFRDGCSGSSSTSGAGVLVQAPATLRNLTVEGNVTTGSGAGVATSSASSWFQCSIRENDAAAAGSGMLLFTGAGVSTLLYAVRIERNQALNSAGLLVLGGSVSMVNGVIMGNGSSGAGSAIANTGSISIDYSTIAGNGPGMPLSLLPGSTTFIGRSIVWGNSSPPASEENTTDGNKTVGYYITLTDGDGGDIDTPPSAVEPFVDPPDPSVAPRAAGDLRLTSSATYAIDVAGAGRSCPGSLQDAILPGLGYLCAGSSVRFDILGAARTQGVAQDLGAYER